MTTVQGRLSYTRTHMTFTGKAHHLSTCVKELPLRPFNIIREGTPLHHSEGTPLHSQTQIKDKQQQQRNQT
jgi:hypothetical protein